MPSKGTKSSKGTGFEVEDEDIRAYLIKNYRGEKLSNIMISCVITQISIIQQIRGFKTLHDMYEAIDDCTYQYMEIIR